MQKAGKRFLLLGVLCASCAMLATTLVQMNLTQLTDRADKVFRGRVLSIDSGSIAAGGGQIPTVTYKIVVEDSLKGDFAEVKDQKVAEIRMWGARVCEGMENCASSPHSPTSPR